MLNDAEYKFVLDSIKSDRQILNGFIKLVPPQTQEQKDHTSSLFGKLEKADVEKIILEKIGSIENKTKTNKAAIARYKYGYQRKEGKRFPTIIAKNRLAITDPIKEKIIKCVLKNKDAFYSYSLKSMMEEIVPWVTDESTAIKLITDNSRILTAPLFEQLLLFVPDGINNANFKSLADTMLFAKIVLSKIDTDTDEGRRKALNIIAERTQLAGSLSKVVNFTYDDLATLPPVRRLNFLQYMFSDYMLRVGVRKKVPHFDKFIGKIINTKWKQVRLSLASVDKMEKLLFSVSIQKNDKVSSWFDLYKAFLDYAQKPSINSGLLKFE